MDDLTQIARNAMLERGMLVDFPQAVEQEAETLTEAAKPRPSPEMRDLRELLWVSIDNDDSLDLDQVTYAEKDGDGKEILYVAIADVDSLVDTGTAIDQFASSNTTSVYTPTAVFPMLPTKLSTNLTSLNEKCDRAAIVVEIEVGKEGEFEARAVYPAWVRNQAKLTYNKVAPFLESKGRQGDLPDQVKEQLLLQDSLAQRIKENRYRQGSLSFGTIEMKPSIVNGKVVDLKATVHNRANALIENAMIAANVGVTRFLSDRKLPTFRRIVRTPLRWDRIVMLAKERGAKLPPEPDVKALRQFLLDQRNADPQRYPDLSMSIIKLIGRGEYVVGFPGEQVPGHFDLALHDYSHTTAPNRRYPDLIMQRLLKNVFYGGTNPYSDEELVALAQHCTEKEDDAVKVERRVKKSAAAMMLESHIGQEYKGFITGTGEKGTWVRVISPPVEGRLAQGYQGLDVGDYVTVKLIRVDVSLGHIDFAKIKS
ncbi:MAG: RNB domain-containing ribonuclease [Parachlamydia sp.]|nr:RNB domain-containing ribonuclease [Parachlamydia sp.]